MKKLFIVAVVASFGMVSCKKDYTCTCTAEGESETTVFKDTKKKDAKDACEAREALYTAFGAAASCEI